MSLIDKTDERGCFVDCGQEDCPCKKIISRGKIDEMVKYVFNQPEPTERKVVAITGCSTYGWIYYDNFCGNPDCKNCSDRNKMIVEAFKAEVEKQIKNGEI